MRIGTYNKVNTALSRADWAKNVGRGVYLIQGGQPSRDVGAGDEQENPPKKPAADWQKQLGVSNPLHAATMATGGWMLSDLITETAYKEALNSYREGPA